MNKYIGKVCPYCKTEFKEGDDIVLCSSCDMPHHKECWIENQGCTTFGCMGTIKSIDGSDTTVTMEEIKYDNSTTSNSVFCTKCGAQNSTTSSFCVKCGNRLVVAGPAPTPTPTPPTYTQANPQNNNPYSYVNQNTYGNTYGGQTSTVDLDVVQLIGKKAEYYVPKFQQMNGQSNNISWNWPAFLFTAYWLLYRKMYVYGIGFLAAVQILSLIGVPAVLFWIAYIAMGLFGNYIYKLHLDKLAQQAKNMNEPYKSQFIQQNGGVNSNAVIIAIVVVFVIGLVL